MTTDPPRKVSVMTPENTVRPKKPLELDDGVIRVAVSVLYNENDTLRMTRGFWVCQRLGDGDGFKDFYQSPGGKADKGETPRQAAARELKEETGLPPEQLYFCFQGTREYSTPKGVKYLLYMYFVGLPANLKPTQMETTKGGPWVYMPIAGLKKMKIMSHLEWAMEIFCREPVAVEIPWEQQYALPANGEQPKVRMASDSKLFPPSGDEAQV